MIQVLGPRAHLRSHQEGVKVEKAHSSKKNKKFPTEQAQQAQPMLTERAKKAPQNNPCSTHLPNQWWNENTFENTVKKQCRLRRLLFSLHSRGGEQDK